MCCFNLNRDSDMVYFSQVNKKKNQCGMKMMPSTKISYKDWQS